MNEKADLEVYYNSACPVCNAGIKFQKTRMQDCPVSWKDVHTDNRLVEELGADLEFVRERLHVVDENGQLATDFDAFIAIWRYSPCERWKAALFGLPVLRHLCSLAYNLFARFLYRWNRAKNHW